MVAGSLLVLLTGTGNGLMHEQALWRRELAFWRPLAPCQSLLCGRRIRGKDSC